MHGDHGTDRDLRIDTDGPTHIADPMHDLTSRYESKGYQYLYLLNGIGNKIRLNALDALRNTYDCDDETIISTLRSMRKKAKNTICLTEAESLIRSDGKTQQNLFENN